METINTYLVKKCLDGDYTEIMAKGYNVITLINERFDYDTATKLYHIRDEASILNYGIPIEKRAEYLIIQELKKAQREKRGIKLDKLCLHIIPLLKNGIQVNNKMIKEILNEVAYKDKATNEWRLKDKKGTQGDLFND